MRPNYENIIEKNIITAVGGAGITITSQGLNKYPLNRIYTQIGNKLSLDDGDVLIGTGIHHVMISGSGMMMIKSNGPKNVAIHQNNTERAISMNSYPTVTDDQNITKSIAPVLLSVSSGDRFSLKFYGAVNDYISNYWERTYLTIEVVD